MCDHPSVLLVILDVPYCPAVTPPLFATYFQEKEAVRYNHVHVGPCTHVVGQLRGKSRLTTLVSCRDNKKPLAVRNKALSELNEKEFASGVRYCTYNVHVYNCSLNFYVI